MAEATKRRRKWPFVLGGVVVLIGALVVAFRWDWLIPIIAPRASAALGRSVKIGHLHVRLGRVTKLVLDDVMLGNPPGWPGGGTFATAERLTVDVDAGKLLRNRTIVLPAISLDHPHVEALQLADGASNWGFGGKSSSGGGGGGGPTIGELVIHDGTVHVKTAKLRGDFEVAVSTRSGEGGGRDQIVAQAKGTYAAQPIEAAFTGGALLSLRDQSEPYPVDLKIENGKTVASAVGTVQDPLAFAGANVTLSVAGPDMSLLLPLTGIAIPKTPPYKLEGKLDYTKGIVKFTNSAGQVGSSDLEGNYDVDTSGKRPVLTADLRSKRVDLADLGGFIGAQPGDASKGTKAPSKPSGKVLPDVPVSLPRLTAADVHLKYRAARIEGGKRQPLDDMVVAMDIVDGAVSLHPLSFGIGSGKIESTIELKPSGEAVATRADVDFQRVDLGKLLSATGVAHGAGLIGGRATIVGTGGSLAQILGGGNGEVRLYMGPGGNVSALLVDLSGLEFGNALLSALGIPNRSRIECFISDVMLTSGEAQSRLTMLDTDENRVGIVGGVNLRNETLNLRLHTASKHFSVGTLPLDIGVEGTLAHPSIDPHVGEAGVRAGAAAALGVLNPIAALLPTIQTGIGDDHACTGLLHEIKAPPRVPHPAARTERRPARRR